MTTSDLKRLEPNDLDFITGLYNHWHLNATPALLDAFILFHNALLETDLITCNIHRGDDGKFTRAGITYKVSGFAVVSLDIQRKGIKLLFYRAGGSPYPGQHLVSFDETNWSGVVYLTTETWEEALSCAIESASLRMSKNEKTKFIQRISNKDTTHTSNTDGFGNLKTNLSVKSIIKTIAPAIFVRNHKNYIEEACKRNNNSPLRQTTFRSSKVWANAQFALECHKVLTCYLSPIGEGNTVQYQAVIHQIQLHPKQTDPITKELLSMELNATKKEGLWESDGKDVNTLYTIAHCEKLKIPFPITELVKIDGNEPISENYGYGYSLVYEVAQPVDEVLLISPEETPYESDLYEGTPRKSSVMARQRSAAARKKCLDQYGYICTICGFDFERSYGSYGEKFIHVHPVLSQRFDY